MGTLLGLAALLAIAPGCVTRKMFIKSEPAGARVMIDGTVVGTTPYEADFVSYGTRRVDLDLEGYQRLRGSLPVERPWWQAFPIDLFTDLLWPWTLDDEHHFAFQMQPVSEDQGSFEEARAVYDRMRTRMGAPTHP